jgi:cobalt-precorrin 5A hydrolase
MGVGQTMIVAGIGCRKGASAREINAVISAALSRAGLRAQALDVIAAPAMKGGEPGIAAAARDLGVPLVLVPQADLESAGARTITRSERIISLMGVPSAAEAAALAAAGSAARLLAPRTAVGPATCALATSEAAP